MIRTVDYQRKPIISTRRVLKVPRLEKKEVVVMSNIGIHPTFRGRRDVKTLCRE